MDIAKNELLMSLSREDSLDLIQKYIEKKENVIAFNKKDISNEMFRLFFDVIELGKEVRLSLKDQDYQNTELKIADIFLELLLVCSSLNINLFDTLQKKEQVLSGKVAKWF